MPEREEIIKTTLEKKAERNPIGKTKEEQKIKSRKNVYNTTKTIRHERLTKKKKAKSR